MSGANYFALSGQGQPCLAGARPPAFRGQTCRAIPSKRTVVWQPLEVGYVNMYNEPPFKRAPCSEISWRGKLEY